MAKLKAATTTPPFIVNTGTTITGLAQSSPNSYCYSTTDSRYVYNINDPGTTHNLMFKFSLDLPDGTTTVAYCLEKGVAGPNNVPYQSDSPENIVTGVTSEQRLMVEWLLANAYGASTGQETLDLAGIGNLGFNDDDARALTQTAIWESLGQLTPAQAQFMDCDDPTVPHVKNNGIQSGLNSLLAQAQAYAKSASNPPTALPGSQNPCPVMCNPDIQCCNDPTFPDNDSDPYAYFIGCPYDLREVCGRKLLGPFQISSNIENATTTVTITPCCYCGPEFTYYFADFCGNRISNPSLNQEFYIIIPMTQKMLCINICATVSGTFTQVVFMYDTIDEPHHQDYGTAFEEVPYDVTTCICVCLSDDGCHKSKCHPYPPHSYPNSNLVVNNNNNNNNGGNNPCPPGPYPPGPYPPGPWPPGPCPPGPCPPGPYPPGPYPPGPWPPCPYPPCPCPPPTCPTGQHYEICRGCVVDGSSPPTCPTGQHYQPCIGCVPDKPYPPGPYPPGPYPPGPYPPDPCPCYPHPYFPPAQHCKPCKIFLEDDPCCTPGHHCAPGRIFFANDSCVPRHHCKPERDFLSDDHCPPHERSTCTHCESSRCSCRPRNKFN
ncbi:MAG: thioester domain-containing protein [Clostridioides sp.]|nr:thioester domain-containing protein [Clostridioides sp.]